MYMSCDRVREQLEAYALGALDDNERAQVEAHLSTCDACRQLAAEYAQVITLLPQALAYASPVSMPASLKPRVMRGVQVPPTVDKASNQPRPWQAWLNWRTLGFALAVLLLLFAFGWAFQLNTALAQERALRAEYANLVGQQETVLEVIDSPKTLKAQLKSTTGSPAYGKLYTRPDLADVVVMAARLPPPPQAQSYHLWLSQQGPLRDMGALNVNEQGFGLIVFNAGQNGPVYDSARLILQRDGAAATDGNVVLAWDAPK
jgi:hypothetical protein